MPPDSAPQSLECSSRLKGKRPFAPLGWLLAAVLLGGLLLIPGVRPWLWQTASALFGSDDTQRRALVERLGIWGPLALLAGMLLQAVVPLLPAAADVVLASLLYGFWWGFAIVYTGTLLGAALGYAVGRRYGGWAVRRLAGETMTRRLEQFAERRGVQAVLLVRLMPALKAEVMNLVAGAVGMSFWPFMAASALGALPATALVVWLAASPQRLFWGVLGLSVAVGLGAAGRWWWHRKVVAQERCKKAVTGPSE
ncbi:TVP38/TMEM64 family protein [Deinococcus detaillensis]|uniref:TVP38/TMEM64 family protein n=1 Tax=Deinococcus detaillensis TaxID=2592048 RepID=UPI001CDBD0F1|nr:TVP38/TMEM64 family protein [Deinococcus detaillensis]